MKLHDYMLKRLLVPNPQELKKKDYNKLIGIFEQIRNVEFPSILKQLEDKHPARKLIDQTWLEILGYKGDAAQLLDQLYQSLAKEIIILKKMMAEKA